MRPAQRGWLTNGLAALAISALGLGVATTLDLTGNERSDAAVRSPVAGSPATREPAAQRPTLQVPAPQAGAVSASLPPEVAEAFPGRDEAAAATSRSAQLRTAIVHERAAQRSEEMSKTADAVARAARAESSAARDADLKATDKAIRSAAVRLAAERLQRAIAARAAAAAERARAEAAREADSAQSSAPATDSSPPAPSVEPEVPSGGGSASPVPGAVIGAHFGQYGLWSRYHTGLDFRAGHGTPIRAVKSGVVVYAGNSGDWAGNHVAVKHGDGKTTMSSHMSSMSVTAGQTVSAGQVIGYVGSTGRAFGAHLHFELYPVGVRYGDVYKAIDPQPWLVTNGVQTR
ncbi:MAG: peptidoglycan DD-metalloendopeptidase family protein [Actinomycetes bacterium]